MTFADSFTSWQDGPVGAFPGRCSPNLLSLALELEQRWPGWSSLGCLNRVLIPNTNLRSSHWYGAAIDLRYPGDRDLLTSQILPYLVAWSSEWHLQRIHDYVGCRIWTAGRTPSLEDACTLWWKAQRPGDGMGEAWATYLHLEVTPLGWFDSRSAVARGVT